MWSLVGGSGAGADGEGRGHIWAQLPPHRLATTRYSTYACTLRLQITPQHTITAEEAQVLRAANDRRGKRGSCEAFLLLPEPWVQLGPFHREESYGRGVGEGDREEHGLIGDRKPLCPDHSASRQPCSCLWESSSAPVPRKPVP